MKVTISIALLLCLAATCSATAFNLKQLETDISHGRVNPTQADLANIFKSYGYNAHADSERFMMFVEKVSRIVAHNANPNKTYTQKINKMTFKTKQEMVSSAGSQNCSATAKENTYENFKRYDLTSLPEYVDWRLKGVVSPVKDQGECGSCWTFSTTGAVESHWAIHTGNAPLLFSEQQLVDCAGDFNNFGCNGGLPSQAFEYIASAGGLQTEGEYPYQGTTNPCEFNPNEVAVQVKSSYNITFQDEEELIYHLATVGPISIAYEVTDEFVDYQSGVFSDPDCSTLPEDVNHAVLAVGYNATGGYYIVKNSWGEDWGINGYFYIEMGVNMCGLADCASYPLLADHNHHQA